MQTTLDYTIIIVDRCEVKLFGISCSGPPLTRLRQQVWYPGEGFRPQFILPRQHLSSGQNYGLNAQIRVVPYPFSVVRVSVFPEVSHITWGIGNRKALCQVPIFPYFSTFLGMQCFCCYIIFDPLCSYSFSWIMFLNVMKGLCKD